MSLNLPLDGRLGIGLDHEYCVTALMDGGPGELAGVEVDDQLVEVNGVSVFETDKPLSELMPKGGEPLMIGLRRPPSAKQPQQAQPAAATQAAAAPSPTPEVPQSSAPAVAADPSEDIAKAEAEAEEEARQISAARAALLAKTFEPSITVLLVRPDTSVSLGVNVEYMDGHGLPEITRLTPNGLAEATGKMGLGDVITAVNGVDTSLGPNALVAALGAAQGRWSSWYGGSVQQCQLSRRKSRMRRRRRRRCRRRG